MRDLYKDHLYSVPYWGQKNWPTGIIYYFKFDNPISNIKNEISGKIPEFIGLVDSEGSGVSIDTNGYILQALRVNQILGKSSARVILEDSFSIFSGISLDFWYKDSTIPYASKYDFPIISIYGDIERTNLIFRINRLYFENSMGFYFNNPSGLLQHSVYFPVFTSLWRHIGIVIDSGGNFYFNLNRANSVPLFQGLNMNQVVNSLVIGDTGETFDSDFRFLMDDLRVYSNSSPDDYIFTELRV